MAGDQVGGACDEMLECALMAFISGTSSSMAAQMAGVDRQTFLYTLIEREIPMADETPDDMLENLRPASSEFGSDRLQRAVAVVRARRRADQGEGPGVQHEVTKNTETHEGRDAWADATIAASSALVERGACTWRVIGPCPDG